MAINANAGIDVLVQAKDEASKIIKQVDNNIQKTLSSIQQRATEVGMTLTKVLTVPITLGAGAIVKFGADFDKSMTESLAIMGDISDQMREKMESTAIEVSKHVNYSAKQAAESYFFLASAGLDAAQSIAALPQVAKFAQAGVFDLATATDMLTDSQSALGLTSKDAAENMENMARISDVLVKANTMANASVREFAEALTNRAAAALRANNKEVEEGVAVLAAFADQGMKGARAGEQLNIMLRDMQNAARDNADEFKRFNINIYDAEGNMNNMADIIADLEKAFSGLSAQQRSATMSALGFTAESAASINMLIGTSEAIRKYEKELKNAQGTTEEIANKQLEHFLAQLDLLKSKVIASALELWMLGQPVLNETVLPALEKIVGKIDSLVKWFSSLSPEMQKAIMITAALTAALGPAALAVAGLAMALKTLAIGPVGIVITGIVGIISVVTILSAKFASLTYEMHGLSGNFNKLDLNAARKELDLTKEKIESLEGKLEEFDIDPKLERNKFRPEIQDVLAQYDMLIKRKEELITKIDSLLKTGEDEKLQALLNKITEMHTLGEISREEYREYLQSIVDDTEQFSEKYVLLLRRNYLA